MADSQQEPRAHASAPSRTRTVKGEKDSTDRKQDLGSMLPTKLRTALARIGKRLTSSYGRAFKADPNLKDKACRYLRRFLPPRSRPGPRPNDTTTKAIRLFRTLRRQHPEETT